jgi:hypothetical protein
MRFFETESYFRDRVADRIRGHGIACTEEVVYKHWNRKGLGCPEIDIQVFSIDPNRSIGIECKVNKNTNVLSHAIGQCLVYRKAGMCTDNVLCIPSNIYIHDIIKETCDHYNIRIANEVSIIDILLGIYSMDQLHRYNGNLLAEPSANKDNKQMDIYQCMKELNKAHASI